MSDAQTIIEHLQRLGHLGLNEQPRAQELTGGVSNLAILIERNNGEAWVVKQALAKLRVTEADWYCDPARVHREADGLRWLEKIAPPGTTTPLIFEDRENHLLAMAAVPKPHEVWKTLLLQGEIETDHVHQFAKLLAAIHVGGYEKRDVLSKVFADTRFFEALRLEPYYSYAAQQVPVAADFLNKLIADTRTHRDTIVHGDYSPKNILVHKNKLILIDHEVIHFGDPAFDIGFSLTHLLSKAHHLADDRDAFASAALQYWMVYRQTIGDLPFANGLEAQAVRHTLGCLLARTAGRSPLEYLTPAARQRQRDAVAILIQRKLKTISQLIESWIGVL